MMKRYILSIQEMVIQSMEAFQGVGIGFELESLRARDFDKSPGYRLNRHQSDF